MKKVLLLQLETKTSDFDEPNNFCLMILSFPLYSGIYALIQEEKLVEAYLCAYDV